MNLRTFFMRNPSGIPWLDAAVQQTGIEPMTDTEGVQLIIDESTGVRYSTETIRRLPIPYRRIGRERIYRIADAVAHAKKIVDEAPIIRPSAPARRRRIRRSAAEEASANLKVR
jgi:hypothetical protein